MCLCAGAPPDCSPPPSITRVLLSSSCSIIVTILCTWWMKMETEPQQQSVVVVSPHSHCCRWWGLWDASHLPSHICTSPAILRLSRRSVITKKKKMAHTYSHQLFNNWEVLVLGSCCHRQLLGIDISNSSPGWKCRERLDNIERETKNGD